MIYKINGKYAPIEVFDWYLKIVYDNSVNWCVNRYAENGYKVKELIIL